MDRNLGCEGTFQTKRIARAKNHEDVKQQVGELQIILRILHPCLSSFMFFIQQTVIANYLPITVLIFHVHYLTVILSNRYYYYPQFIDEETEALIFK